MSLVYLVHKAGSCTDAFCVAVCSQREPLVQFAVSPRQRNLTKYTALNIISYSYYLFKEKVLDTLVQWTAVSNCVITYHICSIC
jgi:Na+(H+)/acetate symporter ActP